MHKPLKTVLWVNSMQEKQWWGCIQCNMVDVGQETLVSALTSCHSACIWRTSTGLPCSSRVSPWWHVVQTRLNSNVCRSSTRSSQMGRGEVQARDGLKRILSGRMIMICLLRCPFCWAWLPFIPPVVSCLVTEATGLRKLDGFAKEYKEVYPRIFSHVTSVSSLMDIWTVSSPSAQDGPWHVLRQHNTTSAGWSRDSCLEKLPKETKIE